VALDSHEAAAINRIANRASHFFYRHIKDQMWSTTFDPDNRLVARGLEAEWENCPRKLDKAKAELARREALRPKTLGPDERSRLLALGTDLLKVWQAPTTLPRDKKELFRTVLHSCPVKHAGLAE
jgi:hypothetical protein